MTRKTTFLLAIVTGLGLAIVGCSEDQGGKGGTGGVGPGTAMVNVSHLAWTIPPVDILVDGEVAVEDLAYGESSGRAELTAGQHTIGIALADTDTGAGGNGGSGGGTAGAGGDSGPDVVFEIDVTLVAGQDLTVAAYRTEAADGAGGAGGTGGTSGQGSPVNVFVFDNSTMDLASGEGRVSVGHGADDPAVATVDVYTLAPSGAGGAGGTGGTGGAPDPCTVLLEDFMFEQIRPDASDVLDLAAGEYTLAVVVDGGSCPDDNAIVRVAPVTADAKSNLVVVDEDTETSSLVPEIYAIVGDADPVKLAAPTQ